MNIAFTKRLTGRNKARQTFIITDWTNYSGNLYYLDFAYEDAFNPIMHSLDIVASIYEENATNDFDEVAVDRVQIYFDSGNNDRATTRIWARAVAGSMFDGQVVVIG